MTRLVDRIARTRILLGLGALLAAASFAPEALALTYTSGDVLYVAYQAPNGPNYIVDLGPQSQFVNATTPLTFANVTASDLNGVLGSSAANITVALFGVLNPSSRDGILSANGPVSDFSLSGANVLGAVNQTDSFGNGVAQLSSPVPSANPAAGAFADGGATGSYESTLNAVTPGSLGNNLSWSVETPLSDVGGVRNTGAVLIPFFKAVRNPFTGLSSRAIIGFFTLNPDGTITYSPHVFPYASGDILYVAYQAPLGPNYIVNMGPRDIFLNATTTMPILDVLSTDLDGVMGPSAPSLNVALFGVLNPSTRDGILSANGPVTDDLLATANVIGAVNQTDSFGNGVKQFSSLLPSANTRAGSFSDGGQTGSYQSSLNAFTPGSLGNNVGWTVETQLSDAAGARNAGPALIPFYKAVKNPFLGTSSRAAVGFFTLFPDGTVSYSPDGDGDQVANEVDCSPADGTVWAVPGEVPAMTFASATSFSWSAPLAPGGTAPLYDVVRATITRPGTAPVFGCLQPDLGGQSSSDTAAPPAGQAFLYLVRAGNACGEGLAGTRSNGQPISAPACP